MIFTASLAGLQVAGGTGRLLAGAIADRVPGSPGVANARVLAGQTGLGALAVGGLIVAPDGLAGLILIPVVGLTLPGNTGLVYGCLTQPVPDDAIGTGTAGGQTAINVGGLLAPPAFGLLASSGGYDVAWLGVELATAAVAGIAATLARRQ